MSFGEAGPIAPGSADCSETACASFNLVAKMKKLFVLLFTAIFLALPISAHARGGMGGGFHGGMGFHGGFGHGFSGNGHFNHNRAFFNHGFAHNAFSSAPTWVSLEVPSLITTATLTTRTIRTVTINDPENRWPTEPLAEI
jgi:hypothetical protein